MHQEYQYLNLITKVLKCPKRGTRNANTFSSFGEQIEFNLNNEFPLITTKQIFWRGIVEELLFFLRGDTDSTILEKKGINIWKLNTSREFLDSRNLHNYKVGEMGPMYGYNWRFWGKKKDEDGLDQLANVIDLLLNNPTDRRIMMTTYDPALIKDSVLAPCHGIVTQFYVDNNKLSCKMYQRSADIFLGLPFNIASYAALTCILAKVTNLQVDRLIITMGDSHIYEDHVIQCTQQLTRTPHNFPTLNITKNISSTNMDDILYYIENLEYKDFKLDNYVYHPKLIAPIL